MVRKTDIPRHVIAGALALAARKRWKHISLADIAGEAKVPLSQVYGVFASKAAILAGFSRQIDGEVLAALDEAAAAAPPRERLFDVLMKRFDALNPHKEAVAGILGDSLTDPLAVLCGLAQLGRSMAWMLEAAGINSAGPLGLARTKGLAVIYLSTLPVWFRDESPDMARTMAYLDKRLRQAESCVMAFQRPQRAYDAPSAVRSG